jgi:hypothetical protein
MQVVRLGAAGWSWGISTYPCDLSSGGETGFKARGGRLEVNICQGAVRAGDGVTGTDLL